LTDRSDVNLVEFSPVTDSRRSVWRRFSGRGVYPHELAFLLTIPLRRLGQPPHQIVARLDLRPHSRVLEIGPGAGYFSIELAHAVHEGNLVLLDVQREMLDKARRRLQAAGTLNTRFVQGDGANLPFRSGWFDAALLVAVLGEISDPSACVDSLRRVLRPGGLLCVTEMRGDPDALTLADTKALMRSKNFEFCEVFIDRIGFTLTFRAPATMKRA
jgi:uncharacterized protein